MKLNVGSIDRAIRILVSIALLAWAIALGGPIWAYIGVLPLVTGLASWCPAYTLFGIRTCK